MNLARRRTLLSVCKWKRSPVSNKLIRPLRLRHAADTLTHKNLFIQNDLIHSPLPGDERVKTTIINIYEAQDTTAEMQNETRPHRALRKINHGFIRVDVFLAD